MKRLVTFIMFFIIVDVGYAQEKNIDNVLNRQDTYRLDLANVGILSLARNSTKPIEGTVYLFDEWSNYGVIETKKKQNFEIHNINFNARNNVFESKIGNDSIFIFDFTNIEKVRINDKVFKNIYSPVDGGYRIFEVIIQTDDFEIYKDYRIDIRKGNPNPLLARANDKYIMRDEYYAKKGKSFKILKLRKLEILEMVGSKSLNIENYAKKNNLNFKSERDLQKIVNYYSTL